jgi:hypothetical protein
LNCVLQENEKQIANLTEFSKESYGLNVAVLPMMMMMMMIFT